MCHNEILIGHNMTKWNEELEWILFYTENMESMHRYCGQYFRKGIVTDGGEPIGGEWNDRVCCRRSF